MKVKFYCPKHKEKGFYRETIIADSEESAWKVIADNNLIPEAERSEYELEDITQRPTDVDKIKNKIIQS